MEFKTEKAIEIKSQIKSISKDETISYEDKKKKMSDLMKLYKKELNTMENRPYYIMAKYYHEASKHVYFDGHYYISLKYEVSEDNEHFLAITNLNVNTNTVSTRENSIKGENISKWYYNTTGDVFDWKYLYGEVTSVKVTKKLKNRLN